VAALGLLEVDADKRQRVAAQLQPLLTLTAERHCERSMELDRDHIRALVAMGPSAYHLDAATIDDRVAQLAPTIAVTAAVTISTYERR
jgi:hypothetical protein